MYTPEEEEKLSAYDGTLESVQQLSQELNRSQRSIIGKLSKMGIYQKATYKSKNQVDPITKLELVAKIEEATNLSLPGLDKAPKETLKVILSWANRAARGTLLEPPQC